MIDSDRSHLKRGIFLVIRDDKAPFKVRLCLVFVLFSQKIPAQCQHLSVQLINGRQSSSSPVSILAVYFFMIALLFCGFPLRCLLLLAVLLVVVATCRIRLTWTECNFCLVHRCPFTLECLHCRKPSQKLSVGKDLCGVKAWGLAQLCESHAQCVRVGSPATTPGCTLPINAHLSAQNKDRMCGGRQTEACCKNKTPCQFFQT